MHYKVSAQFNDSIHNYVSVSATGNFNQTSEGSSAISNNIFEFKHRTKTIAANTVLKYVFGEQDRGVTNNDYNGILELNRYFKDQRLYAWQLTSYGRILSLDVRHQFQSGPGLAYNLVAKSNFTFNISDGILYEYSEISGDNQPVEMNQSLRNSLRLQVRAHFREAISFKSTFYLQNALKELSDAIIREETDLNVRLNKMLSTVLKLQYNMMTSTEKETLMITWGLSLRNFF